MEVREPSAKYLRSAGYVHTELGVLPTDWRLTEIGQIAETSSGTTPPRSQYDRYFKGGVHAWVKTLDLNNAEILETDESVTDKAVEETSLRLFPEGSVLVAMYGGLRQIGRTGLLRLPAAVNQAITAIRPNPTTFCPEFLLFYLNHRVGHWQSVASSSRKDPNITGADVRAFKLPLPEIDEQQKIAAALTDAAALIDSLEQLLTKKRQIKQGAMQELLTGKRRLPGFNAPWIPRSMADLFDFSGGLSASRDQLGDTGPCYLHYGDIHLSHKTHIDLDAEHHQMPRLDVDLRKVSSSALLRNGDVVFVDASEDDQGVSKHVVIHSRDVLPLISGLHTIVARPKSDELVDLYKRYCFQAPPVQAQFRFYAVGTKVSGVSKGNIGKIMLNVPLPVEQKEIAACLAEMDAEIYALESRLTKARALKQAMAQVLLTGRIRLVEPSA